MPTAAEFAAVAESMRGVRFRRHGRSRRVGLDCAGLVVASLAEVGVTVADTRDYDPLRPDPAVLWRLCRDGGDEHSRLDCGEGRVGLCRWKREEANEPRHLVVMLSHQRIAHVDMTVGRGRVTVVPAAWLDGRLIAVFRVRGLEYGSPW